MSGYSLSNNRCSGTRSAMVSATSSKTRELEKCKCKKQYFKQFSHSDMQILPHSSQFFYFLVCSAQGILCPANWYQVAPPQLWVLVQGMAIPGHVKEVGSDLCLCTEQHRARLVQRVIQRHAQLAVPSVYNTIQDRHNRTANSPHHCTSNYCYT